MFRFILVIILINIIFSCNNKTPSSENILDSGSKQQFSFMKNGVLHLDLNEARKHPREVKLSGICDSLIYIPLETNNQIIVGIGGKYKIDGNHLFYNYSWGLYHFDLTGKYIGQIGKIGRGPGEFICTDFCIDRGKDIVYAKSNYRHTVLKYNYEGEFLEESSKIEGEYEKMLYNQLEDKIYDTGQYKIMSIGSVKNENYTLLHESSSDGRTTKLIESKYFPDRYKIEKDKYNITLSANSIYQFKDSIVKIQELANDTLFKYENGILNPDVILNNKRYKKQFTYQNVLRARHNKELENMNYNKIIGESDRYIFISGSEQFIYDKYLKSLTCVRKYVNDINFIHFEKVRNIINNQYILFEYEASDFIDLAKKNLSIISNIETRNILKRLACILNEEDNHVIILYKLKKI